MILAQAQSRAEVLLVPAYLRKGETFGEHATRSGGGYAIAWCCVTGTAAQLTVRSRTLNHSPRRRSSARPLPVREKAASGKLTQWVGRPSPSSHLASVRTENHETELSGDR